MRSVATLQFSESKKSTTSVIKKLSISKEKSSFYEIARQQSVNSASKKNMTKLLVPL